MTGRATYLLYCRSKEEVRVAEDLRLDGIDVWCGRVIRWKRKGKKRRPEPYEEPALPNYIWATMNAKEFYIATAHKFVYPTVRIVGHKASKGLHEFQKMTDQAYQEADAIRRKAETPPPEFHANQAISVIGGPFASLVFNFRRIANPDDPLNRKVVVEGPHGEIELDPLDVKAAE